MLHCYIHLHNVILTNGEEEITNTLHCLILCSDKKPWWYFQGCVSFCKTQPHGTLIF